MNPGKENQNEEGPESREEMLSALFGNMVSQQTNLAFMFMGRAPHPETGKVTKDLDAAQFFIEQLEMLQVKTRGNLSKEEESFLSQNLTGLRMAFVEAVEGPDVPPVEAAAAKPVVEPAEAPKIIAPDDESRKKFSKKY